MSHETLGYLTILVCAAGAIITMSLYARHLHDRKPRVQAMGTMSLFLTALLVSTMMFGVATALKQDWDSILYPARILSVIGLIIGVWRFHKTVQ